MWVQCGVCRQAFDLCAKERTLRAREGYWACSEACVEQLRIWREEHAAKAEPVRIEQLELFR